MTKSYQRNCPECGVIVVHSSISSRSHCKNNKCRKCSDKNKDRVNYGILNGNWKGYKDLSLSYFNNIKRNAGKRNIIFDVTLKDIWNQFEKQNKKCSYTGLDLELPRRGRKMITGNSSLDRIDSTKGYTKDNIQWVYKDINWMKQDFTNEHFIKLCKLVTENMNNKEKLVDLITNQKWSFDLNKTQKENFESFLQSHNKIKQLDSVIDTNDYTGNLNHSILPELPIRL